VSVRNAVRNDIRPDELPIGIDRGDVRRAVQGLARAIEGAGVKTASDDGVALMMAILLVEQLAKAQRRDPIVVLLKMACCFALSKRDYRRCVSVTDAPAHRRVWCAIGSPRVNAEHSRRRARGNDRT
jgi:hypothetical protein